MPGVDRVARATPTERRVQRQDPVEDRLPTDRPHEVVVGAGPQGAAAIFGIVALEHHGDVCILGPRIGAQPAAHLQAGEVRHHPVDEDPHRAFEKHRRAVCRQPPECEHGVVMFEVLEGLGGTVGGEDDDPIHTQPNSPASGTLCVGDMTHL